MNQYGDYQNEIYVNGLSGALPTMPMTFPELEAWAQATLRPDVLSYTAGGAGDEFTQRANVTAFTRWALVPRMLWGLTRRKGGDHSLAALKSIRAGRPDGAPIYVIMDNLSAKKLPPCGPGRRATRSSCV